MYDCETGLVLGERKSCSHLETEEADHTLLPHQIGGKDYLLVGCTACRVIRIYESRPNSTPISCEKIGPQLMCKGPDGAVLVLDKTNRSISQLCFSPQKQLTVFPWDYNWTLPRAMCYSDKHGNLVIMHDRYVITGLNLATGELKWSTLR